MKEGEIGSETREEERARENGENERERKRTRDGESALERVRGR